MKQSKKQILEEMIKNNRAFAGKRTKWVKVSYYQKVKDGYVTLPLIPLDEEYAELKVDKADNIFYKPKS